MAVLLLGMVGWGLTLPTPGDATAYHASVVQAARTIPLEVDGWTGRDQFIAQSAIELLQPNVIQSRWFTKPGEPAGVGVLVVQCRDARDLIGHWPPNCYPAAGMTQDRVEERTWTIDGKTIPGREYWFSKADRDGRREVTVVQNFLILPDGRISRDMATVIDAAGDYRIRYYGSAQVQFISDGSVPADQRGVLFERFITAYAPLINTIATGLLEQP
jgi:hypothetical protein